MSQSPTLTFDGVNGASETPERRMREKEWKYPKGEVQGHTLIWSWGLTQATLMAAHSHSIDHQSNILPEKSNGSED